MSMSKKCLFVVIGACLLTMLMGVSGFAQKGLEVAPDVPRNETLILENPTGRSEIQIILTDGRQEWTVIQTDCSRLRSIPSGTSIQTPGSMGYGTTLWRRKSRFIMRTLPRYGQIETGHLLE